MGLLVLLRKLLGKHQVRSSARIKNFNSRSSYIEISSLEETVRFALRDISASGLSFFLPRENKARESIQIGKDSDFTVVINAKKSKLIAKVVRVDGIVVGCQLINGEIGEYKRQYNNLALAQLQSAM